MTYDEHKNATPEGSQLRAEDVEECRTLTCGVCGWCRLQRDIEAQAANDLMADMHAALDVPRAA